MTALVSKPEDTPPEPTRVLLDQEDPKDERVDADGEDRADLGPTVRHPAAAALVPSLELERLRRAVKSRLFGSEQAPVTIDRYRILGCVGQGGMGIVYAARDERLGRTIALKLLRPEVSGGSTHASDLTKEARSLAKLSHPNVVAVFDVGEHEGQLFVAMEYVEGQSLRRWLETPRSLAEILDVYLAAGRGLAAAHRAGLVHRDFKPDNVLVGGDGRPRILDFGLARGPDNHREPRPPAFAEHTQATATSLSRHGLLLGTPAYMAPEQHLGERADARSDQFGFCVALYQALYQAMPFPLDDLRSLSLAIVSGKLTPPPMVPGLPNSLRRLVLRGLRVEPDARYPSMDALLTELTDIRQSLDRLGRAPLADEGPAAEAEPSYDTRAIQRAFGIEAAQVDAGVGGRPALSESEVEAIADEVGLELGHFERELESVFDDSEVALAKPAGAGEGSVELLSGERSDFGFHTTVISERELSAMPGLGAQRRIVRELERNLGGTGVVEQFEAGMAWANHEAEASLDRRPGGSRLVLRRSIARIARKRRRRGMFIGGFAGTVAGAVMTDLALFVAIEPLLVFGGMAAGAFAGLQIARKIHGRHVREERALLGWVGERTEALIAAEEPPRALRAGKKGRSS